MRDTSSEVGSALAITDRSKVPVDWLQVQALRGLLSYLWLRRRSPGRRRHPDLQANQYRRVAHAEPYVDGTSGPALGRRTKTAPKEW